MPNFQGSDELFAPADRARMEDRRKLLTELNATHQDDDHNRMRQEWGDLHRRAFDLAAGPRCSSWSASPRRSATATAGIRSGKTCCWRGGSSRRARAALLLAAGRAPRPRRTAAPPAFRAGTCTAVTWA